MAHDNKPNDSALHEGPESCAHWEAALVDLLDGTLPAQDRAAFEQHARTCEACRTLLRECGHGREWVRVLHDAPPAVPGDLLGKILSRVAAEAPEGFGEPAHPFGEGVLAGESNVLVMPSPAWSFRGQHRARLIMTAAMAFFSIALTMSITGIHLGDVQAAVHSSGSMQATAFRQFFDTKKQVVSFYDNLRLVREVEATVEDLRHSAKPQPQAPSKRLQPSARQGGAALPEAAPLLAGVQTANPFQADERTTL